MIVPAFRSSASSLVWITLGRRFTASRYSLRRESFLFGHLLAIFDLWIRTETGKTNGLPVAPITADEEGARRAGQGRGSGERSERTLDAPKRSRKMLRRSDGTQTQVYPPDMPTPKVPAVQSHPEIMSGIVVFAGTRIPSNADRLPRSWATALRIPGRLSYGIERTGYRRIKGSQIRWLVDRACLHKIGH